MSSSIRKLGPVSVLARELADDGQADFSATAEPYRRELLAHCYRMTGSLHDSEDLVQETLLRAWKAYDRFEGKSSVRTWLHRIATNTCLTALESRRRRPLPTGLGAPSSDPTADLVEGADVPWLEPFPESASDPADPASIVGSRESVRLAFVAALQHLSPRQRAVLVLRDVLQWKAAEVADAIGTSTAAVNSLLQRARSQLDAAQPSADDPVTAPDSPDAQDRLARYIAAFEDYDIERLTELLTSEAIWEMPPYLGWYQGAQAIITLIHQQCPAESPGDMRLIPMIANGQPAAAMYMRDGDGHVPFQLHVLDMHAHGVSRVVAFLDTSLFAKFGLPERL
ncbi:sigma-70 family RNA polymerase sigma factor SigG [Mycobacterium cookii]|uniref:RNA polymerase sigma factor n=1 Tax=Mycobacterium cookii TaxID=1775 RepID=A0A7I7L1N1_9MYCO|nr:sigma-70 family RNA polymerase sigma factor [Mycobacterium cookii]BBX47492.1 ECF RNA polymerase sigma factor SigG [Mycobacterium cookii]